METQHILSQLPKVVHGDMHFTDPTSVMVINLLKRGYSPMSIIDDLLIQNRKTLNAFEDAVLNAKPTNIIVSAEIFNKMKNELETKKS